ncbi:hypothetical protein GCM10027046_35520 [Uliginosibacterium flavum]|uniref:IgaA/UmoB family intracellular growth attenuator n=1 Tax=Uliginosibacterium flavum TaxID=1396831 RepID=A0ABV2TNH3_9RHOO
MQTLQLILFIGLALYSIYSAITYALRRSDNKGALNELKAHGKPHRGLSAEEKSLLQPFLVDPAKPGKIVSLLNENVYELFGEFVRHGLHVSNGGETMHDTLGGVDVVLPYDARDFISIGNRAEVVLTEKFALVITLNQNFDLAAGRERAQQEQAQQHQWNAGQSGELAGGLNSQTEAAASADTDIGSVRLISQRNETPAEAAVRAHPGWGGIPLLILIPAFILLTIAGYADAIWLYLAPALTLFALALWLIWRPRSPASPQKVNRVEGTLTVVSLQSPSNSNVVSSQLFLGDKFPLVLPEHWKQRATVPPDSRVTLEMRVDDYSVVAFGNSLSIDREERLAPSIYWGRHLTLSLAGVIMLCVGWLYKDSFDADLAHTRAALLAAPAHSYEQAAALIAQPPAPGSMLHLRAQARCQIAPADGNNPSPIDCNTLRWGGEVPQVQTVAADEALLKLYHGEVLEARSNPMLNAILQMQMARAGGAYNPYAGRASVQTLGNLSALVLTVDRECHDFGASSRIPCQDLQQMLGSKIVVDDASDKDIGWTTLLAKARDGSLKQDGDSALANQQVVSSLRASLRDLVAPRVHQLYAKPLQTALASQRGGIVLPLHEQPLSTPSSDPDAPVVDIASPSAGAQIEQSTDWQVQWAAYQSLTQPDNLKAVELNGLVISSDKDERGDLVLNIDPERNPDNYLPALVRLLEAIAGALFLLVHGPLWVIRLRQSMQRNKALAALSAH